MSKASPNNGKAIPKNTQAHMNAITRIQKTLALSAMAAEIYYKQKSRKWRKHAMQTELSIMATDAILADNGAGKGAV